MNVVEQFPLIIQQDRVLVDAKLLHQKLNSKTKFTVWITRRIDEFGFIVNQDYFPNLGKSKTKSTHEYHLTLDMAKELAMLERNEAGRLIRRYFIAKEKEVRGISYLPAEGGLFKGLKMKRINDREMYPYADVLARAGYNAHSSGSRKQRYWMHFIKDGCILYVTKAFALHLYHQKKVMLNRAAMLAAQPVLPLNFGEGGI